MSVFDLLNRRFLDLRHELSYKTEIMFMFKVLLIVYKNKAKTYFFSDQK